MIFVGLWIFTSGLTHVHLTSSASQLKRRTFLQIFSFSNVFQGNVARYRRKRIKRKLLKVSAKEIARHIYCLVRENCEGCTITHLSQTHHTCLYMGKFKWLEYFDAALQRASKTAVMKTFRESLSAADLSIHAQHPIEHWKSVFCGENEKKLKQDILKIL